jgi:DNA-binding MarR family transcriptional regulator
MNMGVTKRGPNGRCGVVDICAGILTMIAGNLRICYRGVMAGSAPDTTAIAAELMTAMTRLRARLRSESTPSDMRWTWSQLAALGRIVSEGPTTTSDVAQAEHVRRQSMTETVAVLRADGLVQAQPDPTDGRKTLLVATRQGHDLLKSILPAREAWLGIAMDATLDDDEQQILHQAAAIMTRLADS